MPAITYADFSGGLDRRLPITVQAANRLWTLKNAYVTTGKKIAKRAGLRKVGDGLIGPGGEKTFGLYSIGGMLTVFCESAATWVLPGAVTKQVTSTVTQSGGGWTLADVVYATSFQSYTYVTGKYTALRGSPLRTAVGYFHHIFDGAPSTEITTLPVALVTDLGHKAPGVTVIASRIFMTSKDGADVGFCAVGNARDWTTTGDAGTLAVALQNNVRNGAIAVGSFQDKLAVMFPESMQTWNVFTDPTQNAIDRRIYGTGSRAPYSLASFGNDMLFLSPSGFRSLNVQSISSRIDDLDVGVPVDVLVKADVAASLATQLPAIDPGQVPTSYEQFQSVWIPQIGQYWTLFPMGPNATRVWAYTYSKLSKLACWSQYDFPIAIKGVAVYEEAIYIRNETTLYEFDPTYYTDDEAMIDVEVQMAFQDAKTPGVAKQFYGADFAISGSVSIAYKFDTRATNFETVSQVITGDTRPGDIVPIEVVAPCIAPVFRQSAREPLQIDALTLYYHSLAAV